MRSCHSTLFLGLVLSSLPLHADDALSVGAGIGSLYSGLGVNIAWRDETSMRYLAVGCPAIHHSPDTGWNSACGVGVGWVDTRLLPQNGSRHATGVYLGPVGYRGSWDAMDGALYGVGFTYHYFYQGVLTDGWNLGAGIAAGRDERDLETMVLFQVGYQF